VKRSPPPLASSLTFLRGTSPPRRVRCSLLASPRRQNPFFPFSSFFVCALFANLFFPNSEECESAGGTVRLATVLYDPFPFFPILFSSWSNLTRSGKDSFHILKVWSSTSIHPSGFSSGDGSLSLLCGKSSLRARRVQASRSPVRTPPSYFRTFRRPHLRDNLTQVADCLFCRCSLGPP